MTKTELVQKLMTDELGLLFVWPQHDNTISRIWSLPGTPQLLESVLNDPFHADPAVRDREISTLRSAVRDHGAR